MGKAEAKAEFDGAAYDAFVVRHERGRTLLCVLQNTSRDSCIELLKKMPSEMTAFRNVLHYMLAEDYPNCIRAIIEALSSYNPATPPLHQAALCAAHSLAQLFLDYGQDPNVRVDLTSHLKQVLPLEVALYHCRETPCSFEWHGCVFKLICKLCVHKRRYLETARVLALQTKELDREILKYVKEGKVEYLCSLMLLGYHTRIPSVEECFEGHEYTKEQMLQLVEIFRRVGDKLQVYLSLPRAEHKIRSLGRVASEIASIFRDAGLPVKSIDTITITGRTGYVLGKKNNGTVGEANRAPLPNNALHGVQELNGSHMAYNVMWGSRSLHTNVHKAGLTHPSTFKGSGYLLSKSYPFMKNSSFWIMALRRAIRHV